MYAIKLNIVFVTVLIKKLGTENHCNITQTITYIIAAATVNMQSSPCLEVGLCHAKSRLG